MKRVLVLTLVLAAAAAAALIMYNRRADTDIESSYFVPKPSRMTPELELLQQYVRINTTNPPGNEIAGARFLADILHRNGIASEIIESAPGRASLYARIKGRRSGEGLLLLSHIDVVAADAKFWTHPPFAAEVALNMMWGRGTLDMKSIGICELEAFIAVARSGHMPERDIVFLATADEERGGAAGMAWLLAHRPDVFAGVRYALNEGGITETRVERISYFGIEIGTKMTVTAILRAASRADMQRVRLALEPYITPRDPERVLPEVRAFLHELAPQRIEQRALLDDIDKAIAAGKFWLLPRGYRELTQNIIWPRRIVQDARGATMDVVLSNLPDEDPDRRIAWLQQTIKPYGATIAEITQKTGPAPLSRRDTPMFALLAREVRKQYGDVPVGTEILVTFSNDSRYLRARGVNCYGMWPFPVDYYQTQGIHSIDERVRLDWFMEGVSLMKSVVRAYAFEN